MSEKRKVLIVAHHLTVGGSQKSLLATLALVDYSKFDVTLYIRKNRLDLLSEVDPHVKIIVNTDSTRYYRKPKSIALLAVIRFFKLFRFRQAEAKMHQVLATYIRKKQMSHELRSYFSNQHFDIAVSFFQGYTMDILSYGIDADKKYCFYRVSVDESHEFHAKAFREIDRIIAVSPKVAELLKKWYPLEREKIVVIDNFIDAEQVVKYGEAEISLPNSHGVVICSCGRLDQVKGFDLAVCAAKILQDDQVDFIWYFVGDGGERESLEKQIRQYRLEDKIYITGMQSNPFSWIKQSDIYVQPSWEESYGRTIKEALILGKPVVSTRTVGGEYVLQDGKFGILCERSSEDMAKAIRELIIDERKRQVLSNCYSKNENDAEKKVYVSKINQVLSGEL